MYLSVYVVCLHVQTANEVYETNFLGKILNRYALERMR
jgi:hypothetical protein